MNDWNIQSRSHACQACAKPFADQQVYHTLLFDLRREIERNDLCEACWKSQHSDGASDRKGFLSHWQGVYEAPPPPREAIQKENAESLLRKLIELNDPKYAAASYILAVMLERKRILRVKEQIRREGNRTFVYEQPKTGDVFTIPDLNLQLNQLEQVQRDVAALLEHGLNPPELRKMEGTPADAPAGETSAGHDEAPLPVDAALAEPEPVVR